jgi:DNA-binding transcriptional regulator YiaG
MDERLHRITERARALRIFAAEPDLPRQLRESSRLSQSQIAAGLGVTPQAIAQWESGTRTPSGDLAAKLMAVLIAASTAATGRDISGELEARYPPRGYSIALEARREVEALAQATKPGRR